MSRRRGGAKVDPRSAALALDVLHVVERCFVPATGPVEARALNQSGFEGLCREMGLVNADWGGRLFAAIDADNTGAIDAFELLNGLCVMGALPQSESSLADDALQRRRLAFRMLDVRAQVTDQAAPSKQLYVQRVYLTPPVCTLTACTIAAES